MKIIFTLLISGLLTSCGWTSRIATHITGSLTYKCATSGVEYVQSDSGLAVHVSRTGTPVACEP